MTTKEQEISSEADRLYKLLCGKELRLNISTIKASLERLYEKGREEGKHEMLDKFEEWYLATHGESLGEVVKRSPDVKFYI